MSQPVFTTTEPVIDRARRAGRRPGRRTDVIIGMEALDQDVWRMTIEDPFAAQEALPGSFVNLYPTDSMTLLPRPLGISRVLGGNQIEVIFGVVGRGTHEFSELRPGDCIDLLGPLGKGFDLSGSGHYILVGGGLGVPPLIRAAQVLREQGGARSTALLGYRSAHFADRFMNPLVDDLHSIDNGQGDVITLLDGLEPTLDLEDTIILTCGPTPMMGAVAAWAGKRSIPTQCCMEARMGCGYGTCVACVVDTVNGRLKVCKDGPVFKADDLLWKGGKH